MNPSGSGVVEATLRIRRLRQYGPNAREVVIDCPCGRTRSATNDTERIDEETLVRVAIAYHLSEQPQCRHTAAIEARFSAAGTN